MPGAAARHLQRPARALRVRAARAPRRHAARRPDRAPERDAVDRERRRAGHRDRHRAARRRVQDRLLDQHRARADRDAAGAGPRLPAPRLSRARRAARARRLPLHRRRPGHRRRRQREPVDDPRGRRRLHRPGPRPRTRPLLVGRHQRVPRHRQPLRHRNRRLRRRRALHRHQVGHERREGIRLRLLPRRLAARAGRARRAEEQLLAAAVRRDRRRADRQGQDALLRVDRADRRGQHHALPSGRRLRVAGGRPHGAAVADAALRRRGPPVQQRGEPADQVRLRALPPEQLPRRRPRRPDGRHGPQPRQLQRAPRRCTRPSARRRSTSSRFRPDGGSSPSRTTRRRSPSISRAATRCRPARTSSAIRPTPATSSKRATRSSRARAAAGGRPTSSSADRGSTCATTGTSRSIRAT